MDLKLTKENIRYAFPKSIPVMCGYVFLGTAYGIVLSQAGYNALWAFLISLVVYAGSMQFVMVPLLASCCSPLTMAVTTFFVNSRHLFYGISFVDAYRKMKTRPYMIFSLTDETYSVLCGCKNEDPQETHRDAWFWISILHQSYWILGSVLGALLGQMLPIDFTGIDFAMTALFVVILLEQIWSDPAYATFPAVCGLIMGLVSLIIFGADKFLLPALIVTILIVTVKTRTEKPVLATASSDINTETSDINTETSDMKTNISDMKTNISDMKTEGSTKKKGED